MSRPGAIQEIELRELNPRIPKGTYYISQGNMDDTPTQTVNSLNSKNWISFSKILLGTSGGHIKISPHV